jgi:hypothetical protein
MVAAIGAEINAQRSMIQPETYRRHIENHIRAGNTAPALIDA